ncbi:MAG: hypothetical protein ACLTSX_13655 [Collinsella sp.]
MRASEIGAASPICVSVHANLTDVRAACCPRTTWKKVPVLESGHIVGIINRSDITQYPWRLPTWPIVRNAPSTAGEGPSGQARVRGRGLRRRGS